MPNNTISNLIGCSHLEWCNMIYEGGLAYLTHYIPNDEHGARQLQSSKAFWNWWRNHWYQRDQQFIHKVDASASSLVLYRLYNEHHDVSSLLNEIFPNAVVLNDSYAAMIDIVHHENIDL